MEIRNAPFDAVIAFAFGNPRDILANKQIADITKKAACDFKIPIFTQNDIPLEIALFAENYFEKNDYLSTLEIALIFKKIADDFGWEKILIIAAPSHIERCFRDLRRLGFIAKPIDDVTYIEWPDKNSWFSKNSTQWWTKSRLYWWIREIPLRLLPWKFYKKITAKGDFYGK